jgi:hypothetical protein
VARQESGGAPRAKKYSFIFGDQGGGGAGNIFLEILLLVQALDNRRLWKCRRPAQGAPVSADELPTRRQLGQVAPDGPGWLNAGSSATVIFIAFSASGMGW